MEILHDYLGQDNHWPLRLEKICRIIREFIRSLQADSKFHDLVKRHPHLIASFEMDYPQPKDEFASSDSAPSPESVIGDLGRDRSLSRQARRGLYRRFVAPFQRPTMQAVDWRSIVQIWGALTLVPGDLWVDLGSGDGQTLFKLASRHAAAHFIGVDQFARSALTLQEEHEKDFPTLSKKPGNVDYHVITGFPLEKPFLHDAIAPRRWRQGHDMQWVARKMTLRAAGRHKASVVSLYLPFFKGETWRRGRRI